MPSGTVLDILGAVTVFSVREYIQCDRVLCFQVLKVCKRTYVTMNSILRDRSKIIISYAMYIMYMNVKFQDNPKLAISHVDTLLLSNQKLLRLSPRGGGGMEEGQSFARKQSYYF